MVEKKDDPLYRHIPSSNEIQAICNEFDMGDVFKIYGDLGGLFNVNLKIETNKGLYVIRIRSGIASKEHLDYQQSIMSILKSYGIPVLTLITTKDGRNYSYYKDRFVQINPYVKGNKFSNNLIQIFSSGKMLCKIHKALADVKAGPLPKWSNYPSNNILIEGLNKLKNMKDNLTKKEIRKADNLYKKVMNKWREIKIDLPETVIHGDWHPWNQLYSNDGTVKCIMDFDFIQRAERIHDVAYALWAILSNKDTYYLGEGFLQGYNELTYEEKNILPIAIARASLFFICTASFISNPVIELRDQVLKQEPFINWVLSKGKEEIKKMCKM